MGDTKESSSPPTLAGTMHRASGHEPEHAPGADAAIDAARKPRTAKAERYFAEDLADQHGWYDRKATADKAWARRFGLLVIACGATITFLQILEGAWIPLVTGAIGAIIALVEGGQRIWKFDETWQTYRAASERMKRERRLYVNGAGDYAAIADDDNAYRAFVVAIEQIIAEEQQIYWQSRAKASAET